MSPVLAIIFIISGCIGIASWFAIVIYGLKAYLSRRPDRSDWSGDTSWNLKNIMLQTYLPNNLNLLTDKGGGYLRKCFIAGIVFFVSSSLMIIADSLSDIG